MDAPYSEGQDNTTTSVSPFSGIGSGTSPPKTAMATANPPSRLALGSATAPVKTRANAGLGTLRQAVSNTAQDASFAGGDGANGISPFSRDTLQRIKAAGALVPGPPAVRRMEDSSKGRPFSSQKIQRSITVHIQIAEPAGELVDHQTRRDARRRRSCCGPYNDLAGASVWAKSVAG